MSKRHHLKKKQRELIKPKGLWINCLKDIKSFSKNSLLIKQKTSKKKIFFPFSLSQRALTKLNSKLFLPKRLHFFLQHILLWILSPDSINVIKFYLFDLKRGLLAILYLFYIYRKLNTSSIYYNTLYKHFFCRLNLRIKYRADDAP